MNLEKFSIHCSTSDLTRRGTWLFLSMCCIIPKQLNINIQTNVITSSTVYHYAKIHSVVGTYMLSFTLPSII